MSHFVYWSKAEENQRHNQFAEKKTNKNGLNKNNKKWKVKCIQKKTLHEEENVLVYFYMERPMSIILHGLLYMIVENCGGVLL